MKKILILVLPVLALAAGVFAGDILRSGKDAPATQAASHDGGDQADDGHGAAPKADDHAKAKPADGHDGGHSGDSHGGVDPDAASYFTFPSQFFVPMMRNGDMGAMMILTLTIETDGASLEPMKQQEHRLRDALLRQLMIHANTGGFDGNFTADARLAVLREDLLKAATQVTDLPVTLVLIEDIARQAGS